MIHLFILNNVSLFSEKKAIAHGKNHLCMSIVHSPCQGYEMQQSAQEHRFYKFAWLTPQSLSSPLTHLVMCIFLEYAREESFLLHLLLFKMSRVTTPS